MAWHRRVHHHGGVTGVTLGRSHVLRGTYAARALGRLRSWPALDVHHNRDNVALAVDGTEVVLLTADDRGRVRLTVPVIGRLRPYLSGQVRPCEDRAWLSVRLEAEPDLDLLLTLTSLAIKVNS